jgi:nucleotide-binding universal stress UspA family protein
MFPSQPPVLAGLDSLPDSLTAVDSAAVEASRRRLPLRLVMCGAASPRHRPSCWRPAFYPLDRFNQAVSRDARRFPALEVLAEIHPGDLSDLLVDESGQASLVVVGPSHTGGYDRSSDHWLTHRVVTHAACPVLVARAGVGTDHQPVVVGVDGTRHCATVVRLAFEEAVLRQVALRAVHVHPAGHTPADELLSAATAPWTQAYPDVTVEYEQISDPDVPHALLCAATGADLIVVGSQRDLGTDLLLGPAGRALVDHAPCAVLVAHAAPGFSAKTKTSEFTIRHQV